MNAVGRNLTKCSRTRSDLLARPQQHVQVRRLPWVPLAYRKGATSRSAAPASMARRPNPRSRTPSTRRNNNRKGPSHRGGGYVDQTKTFRKDSNQYQHQHHHGSISFAIQSHKESLLGMQKELDLSILRYRRALGAAEDDDPNERDNNSTKHKYKLDGGSTHQVTSLLSKLSSLTSCKPDSWKHVEDTEDGFREVGRLVSDMIGLSAKIQNLILKELASKGDKHEEHVLYFYCSLSEQLLLALIEMQVDRLKFADAAYTGRDTTPDENLGTTVGWFGWLKSKLLDQSKEEEEEGQTVGERETDEENKPPMAHEDALCVPRLEHFQCVAEIVLSTLRQELKDPHQSPFRKIRRAQRLQQLLEKTPPNVEPDLNTVKTLLRAYSLIGSFESARSCEKIANKYPNLRDGLFGSVLHAYFMAAKSSPRNQERSKAAVRADELVRLKWKDDAGYEEEKFVHCTKAILCLNAVGFEAIPDVCKRADSLANLCVGRENLEEVFRNGNLETLWKIAPSSLTLPLLNCLVLVYASSRDSSRVNLAKRLLQILLEDSDFKENTDSPYPDVRSCKAVLSGLVGINDRRIRWTRVSPSQSDTTRATNQHLKDSSQENLEYGMELLDHMFSKSQCWPDQPYFHSLFRLLLMARPHESGKAADMLLSKMQIRECFGGHSGSWTMVTRKTYHYVLRAWLASAEAGDSHAAKRALELVEMMEAQSIPLLVSADRVNAFGSAIYRSAIVPDRSTYQLLLKICASVTAPQEKEEALDIALVVNKKMKQCGISSTSDSYSLLFTCCSNLLPENSKRSQSVMQQLLEDAKKQGNINLSLLENANKRNPEETGGSGTGSSHSGVGGGGLLSDLD